jgi:signal transduction histidine kinase
MRNIAGMATMIVMKHRDELPEDVVARLQRIQSNVDQQSSLIHELLEISRITSRPEMRSEVDMYELLRSLTGTFEYEIQKRGIELRIEEPMPTLWIEKNRIRQVFQNLIDNAIKYMHREVGGRIVIRHRHDGSMYEFEVSDNGPGIPEDQQEQIFVVFRRGGQRVGRNAEGKGVGLTVVRTIALNYGGRAWVRSKPGEGTSFLFTLNEDCVRPSEGKEAAVVS